MKDKQEEFLLFMEKLFLAAMNLCPTEKLIILG